MTGIDGDRNIQVLTQSARRRQRLKRSAARESQLHSIKFHSSLEAAGIFSCASAPQVLCLADLLDETSYCGHWEPFELAVGFLTPGEHASIADDNSQFYFNSLIEAVVTPESSSRPQYISEPLLDGAPTKYVVVEIEKVIEKPIEIVKIVEKTVEVEKVIVKEVARENMISVDSIPDIIAKCEQKFERQLKPAIEASAAHAAKTTAEKFTLEISSLRKQVAHAQMIEQQMLIDMRALIDDKIKLRRKLDNVRAGQPETNH